MKKTLRLLDTYGFEYEFLQEREVSLPILYKNKYQFQYIKLFESIDVLFVKANREQTLDSLVNDSIFIENRLNTKTVIITNHDDPIILNKLIMSKIPFISNNAIFLPFLGTVISKIEVPKSLPKSLSLNQQRLLIAILLSSNKEIVPRDLVNLIDISIASVYRILRHFSDQNWVVSKQGYYIFCMPRIEIYLEAKNLFVNPINSSMYVPKGVIQILNQKGINTFKSGFDALSYYTDLADNNDAFGLYKEKSNLNFSDIMDLDVSTPDEIKHAVKLMDIILNHELNSKYHYPDQVSLELWKYNPIIGKNNKLDLITLSIISKDDSDDPRIHQSLSDLEDLIFSILKERDLIVQ